MLDDALAHFKREVQAGKIEIALFELFDDAQRVQIVIEMAAVRAHQFVQLTLAGMSKGRVADIVDERKRFRQLGVQAQRGGNRASDLRDLQRVRQAIAEMIRIPRGEDLGFGFQASERPGMNDSVAVARVHTAVGMRGLRVAPAAGLFCAHRPGSWSE